MHQHQHISENTGDRRLAMAITVNLLLTLAQVVGGIVSGSLSLIADALHNFSDAASLLIAWVARKIGRMPADQSKTFGYKRAEIIATFINLITLVIIGLYLVYEAFWRIYEPNVIDGWMVVYIAAIALVIDVLTAILTYTMSKHSMNIRAAFLHNVSDALASVGVIVAGSLILLYEWYWTDTVITLLIAGYVLYQAITMLPSTVNILMQAAPGDMSIPDVIRIMESIPEVSNVHHVHIWQLDEHQNALEAHVVISSFDKLEEVKSRIKQALANDFDINHSSLEFEQLNCECKEYIKEQ